MKCIDDYINGNLSDAKRGAKRYSAQRLRRELMERGKSYRASVVIADYLKGQETFQAACNAEHADRTMGQ